jgi:hypothetical protein
VLGVEGAPEIWEVRVREELVMVLSERTAGEKMWTMNWS